MDKEEFKRKLKEQQVFEDLKDRIEINTMAQVRYYLLENFLIGEVNARDLYIKITNYRIKKYGTSIIETSVSREDRHKYILNDYGEKIRNKYKEIY